MSTGTQPPWWFGMDSFDAAAHIASRLNLLLAGVEDEETLQECQAAAAVWMRDLDAISEARREHWNPASSPCVDT